MTDPIFVDVYVGDKPCDWGAYIAAGPPFHGAIFKLSQGLDFAYMDWARVQRAPFLASQRYGVDLFDGFYHYLTFHQDGRAQAERYWSFMEQLGGEKMGTLWAMVDVERGGQRIPNPSRQMVHDRVGGFAARYLQLSGRQATLYGGELLRSAGVVDLMECGRSAVALYGSELHGKHESTIQFLFRTGTDLTHLLLWQYVSAEGPPTGPDGYPRTAPGCGRVDMSALVMHGGIQALRSKLWAERPTS